MDTFRVTYKTSIALAKELGPGFTTTDFARVAWPDHPAFKPSASPEQRKKDMQRVRYRAATWLRRMFHKGYLSRRMIRHDKPLYSLAQDALREL